MSSIQSVQGESTAAALAAAAKAQAAKPETASQEATESPAVTRTEAARGDQQAIRRSGSSQPAAQSQKLLAPGNVNLTA